MKIKPKEYNVTDSGKGKVWIQRIGCVEAGEFDKANLKKHLKKGGTVHEFFTKNF